MEPPMNAKMFLAGLVLAGCTHDIETYKPLDVQKARDLDILFVIDDSTDRATYDVMAQQIDVLQSQLSSVDGQLPSLHVGVVTTDLGTSSTDDDAPLRPTVMGCLGYGKEAKLQKFASTITDPYLSVDRTGAKNFTGDLAAELAKLTNPDMPPAGCEIEQPLEAMRRALDPATNPGFLRDGALLSVVFLTNEDDCSLKTGALLEPLDASLGPLASFRCTREGVICDPDDPARPGRHDNCRPREDSQFVAPVGPYIDFLAGLKADRRDVSVSAVGGSRTDFIVRDFGQPLLNPSCSGPGLAYPAVRIGAVVDAFGGTLVDSCTQADAYQQIATPVVNRQRSCFPSLAMSEMNDCSVTEIAGDTETDLERCPNDDVGDVGAGPCWYAYTDAAACPSGANIGIAIRRGSAAAPADGRIEARCFVR
ncbi:MAG: hypothetical protein AB7T06_44260 [Kofleriaceae bacterium]